MDADTPVKSVRKALDALDFIVGEGATKPGVGLSEIAAHLGIQATTARNILKTMESCGYLSRTEGRLYAPGLKCKRLGSLNRILSPESVERINSVLRGMAGKLGETSVFATLAGGERVVIGTVDSDSEIKVGQATVQATSLYRTPTGRVLAAFAGPDELERIVAKNGMPGAAWEGVSSKEALKSALEKLRDEGACEILEREVYAAAVPAMGRGGDVCGSIGCYAPLFRCPKPKQRQIMAELKSCAAKIGEWL